MKTYVIIARHSTECTDAGCGTRVTMLQAEDMGQAQDMVENASNPFFGSGALETLKSLDIYEVSGHTFGNIPLIRQDAAVKRDARSVQEQELLARLGAAYEPSGL